MDWAETTARPDEKHLSARIWCYLYYRFESTFSWLSYVYNGNSWKGHPVFWYWDRFQFIDFPSFVAMTLHVIPIEGPMCLATSNTTVLVNSTFDGDLDDDLYSAVDQLPPLARKHSGKIFFLYIIALDRVMAWRRPGNKPLSGPMMVSLLMHICVTRPQLIKLGFIILGYLAFCWLGAPFTYRKISNISLTKSHNLKVSRLGLQLSFRNIFKPSVKWRMKM